MREDKLCPPSLSKSSFARSKSSVGTQDRVFRPCDRLQSYTPSRDVVASIDVKNVQIKIKKTLKNVKPDKNI